MKLILKATKIQSAALAFWYYNLGVQVKILRSAVSEMSGLIFILISRQRTSGVCTTGNVTTGQLLTVGTPTINTNVNSSQDMGNSAGDVTVTAKGTVTVGAIDTRGDRAGNVTLTGRKVVTVGAIESSGSKKPGNITFSGSEIDLTGDKNSIASNGNLVLQPADPSQNIIIEGPSDTEALNLTAAELNTWRNGFASIAIGRSDGSGTISIGSFGPNSTPNATPVPVTFQDPTTIQSD